MSQSPNSPNSFKRKRDEEVLDERELKRGAAPTADMSPPPGENPAIGFIGVDAAQESSVAAPSADGPHNDHPVAHPHHHEGPPPHEQQTHQQQQQQQQQQPHSHPHHHSQEQPNHPHHHTQHPHHPHHPPGPHPGQPQQQQQHGGGEVHTSAEMAQQLNALQEATMSHDPSTTDPANASSTAAAALSNMFPTLNVPTSTEEQFTAQGLHADFEFRAKPPVGSVEWHKMRKNNHKEVERRRRETINEGINELSKIVPGCEKNKGSILQKAVQFIQQLKANETSNIEKWTLEKLLTEQALGELSQSNANLKAECKRLYSELETYKRLCQSAGLEIPKKTDAAPAAGQQQPAPPANPTN